MFNRTLTKYTFFLVYQSLTFNNNNTFYLKDVYHI